MDLLNSSSIIFDLSSLHRYCGGKPEIEKIAWFKDHVYWHKGRIIDAENISFVIEADRGKQKYTIDQTVFEFEQKDLLEMSLSGTQSGSAVTTLATTRRNELLFRYPAGTVLMPEYPFGKQSFFMTERFNKFLHELEDMLDALHAPGTADQLDILAMAMTAEALAAANNSGTPRETAVKRKLIDMHNLISANPAADINISHWAETNGMSRAVFYREWQKLFNISPYSFVLQKRLQNAQWFLRYTTNSIKEIAELTGFKSTTVFCDVFKKHFSVTPTIFRKQTGK